MGLNSSMDPDRDSSCWELALVLKDNEAVTVICIGLQGSDGEDHSLPRPKLWPDVHLLNYNGN